MSVKALKRQLMAAIAMVLVCTIALGSSTFAWFSMNSTVTATGMDVKAVAESSLVIQNDRSKLGASFGTESTVAFSLSGSPFSLKPATHADKYDDTNATTKGLKYCTNTSDVSIASGTASDGKTLTYGDASTEATASASGYYKDYVVYVASATGELTKQTLNVVLNATADTDTKKALSVDFYVSSKTSETGKYCGTVNLTSLTSGKTTAKELTATDLTSYTIPLYTDTGDTNVCQITMRVYFDGALTYTANATYTAASKYDSGVTYYTNADGTYTAKTIEDETAYTNAGTLYVQTAAAHALAYVRSSTVDTTNIPFTAEFSLKTA